MSPLAERVNRVDIDRDHTPVDATARDLSASEEAIFAELIHRIQRARENQASVVIAFGAHTIKNGLAPVLIRLMETGILTHLATNGAGIIHDWEFAFGGASSEHVEANLVEGRFGNWEETGYFINLAILVGAAEGRGYGESVGSLIEHEGLNIPAAEALLKQIQDRAETHPAEAAAGLDLLDRIRRFELQPGFLKVPHPWKPYSVQAAAYRLGVPLTGHPMIGHDIIYNHPMNSGAAVGRAAERDFLSYAESVSRLEDGVYLSVGSAVMSPMIFEKSLSMSQNLAKQQGKRIEKHFITVVDIAESSWDWSQGEPPEEHPEYYLRFNKSFSRMGGAMRYLQMDNRDFLLHLVQRT